MVRLVIVRDPNGREPDDYFFTTDLQMSAAEVVTIYAGRWGIEVAFRNVKQLVGGHESQSWKGDGPERAAGSRSGSTARCGSGTSAPAASVPASPSRRGSRFTITPWFASKTTPSVADALAELRRTLWHERMSPASNGQPFSAETVKVLVEALAVAA